MVCGEVFCVPVDVEEKTRKQKEVTDNTYRVAEGEGTCICS